MLSALETKIPPPVVLLVLAILIWALPGSSSTSARTLTGGLLVLAGLLINGWPKRLFRRLGTTINPLHPERSSVLITSGLYRYSRNPMYLGYALALLGWVVCQGKLAGFIAVVIFIGYVTRLQIVPEERELAARFPMRYATYKQAVRRWI
ncbi:methyltransferase family protein [Pseudoxanthomonas dokdonensis]|uniref:Protein-S-isoprenylcysteine methyltransferase n=1 Tax=Pseudoxanthomonas dokdonensis TaxID=344882 RepID=A0A0R0CE30_9GAMM|nr:isoprenylcysteine carboxylmethyltransferase family protein [Pseudoxanthomonas dokdonensis]KRG67621.1 hypothetical protein ABB29_15360 [Pseudoxanthomonas dokdonensis]